MADLSITAANVAKAADGQIINGTAGATITAGQAVYKDAADSEIKLAEADNAGGAAIAAAVGIALNGASDGQPIQYITSGGLNPGSTVAVGKIYVVSGNAGGIAPVDDLASSDYTTILGVGTTTSNIKVSITVSGVQVP